MAIRFIDPKTNMEIEVDTVEEYNVFIGDNGSRHDKNFVKFMRSIGVKTLDNCERPVLSGNAIKFKSPNIHVAIRQRLEFEKWISHYDNSYWYVLRSTVIAGIQSNIMDKIRKNIKKYNVDIDEE